MPGKNFRRLTTKSCIDCSLRQRKGFASVCSIDGGEIKEETAGMPLEFVCDEFKQVDYKSKR